MTDTDDTAERNTGQVATDARAAYAEIHRRAMCFDDMLEALRPFAACADELDAEREWDDEEWAKFRLLVKHYRAARAALAKATGGAA